MIRKAEKEDIPRCVQVIRESFDTVAEQFGITRENAPRFTAFAVTQERLAQQMEAEGRPMFVYEEDGTIAGYCSLQILDERTCELNNLAVTPAFRHRGIGGKLFVHAVRTAKAMGCAVMRIGIVEENAALRAWYEKYGAVHVGTKKFDFFPFTCGYMELAL